MDIAPNDIQMDAQPATTAAATPTQAVAQPIQPHDVQLDRPQIDPNDVELDSDKYGTPVEQAKAGAEGVLRGVITAPLASAAERVAGVDPHAVLARQKENPWTAGIGEGVGFVGSAFIPVAGQAGLVGKVGLGAAHAAGLAEAASVGTKLAQGAVKLGTEMALLGGLDETSKLILQDPDQSASSALTNIGLGTALGALTGGTLKSAGMLTKFGLDKSGLNEGAIKEFVERLKARASGVNDAEMITHELQDTSTKFSQMGDELNGPTGLKESTIKASMPEATAENVTKINDQVQTIGDELGHIIKDARITNNPYLKSAIPKLDFHYTNLLDKVTSPETTLADKFKALDQLKNEMQTLVKYGSTAEDSALGKVAKNLASQIRTGLEDSKVWGRAADIQKDVNAAWTKALDKGVKLGQNKFFTNGIVDPIKVQSYLNQNGRSTSQTVRQQMLGKYVEAMDNFQKTVSDIYTKAGLPNAHEPMSMNSMKESLGKPSPWAKAADLWYDKRISAAAGEGIGAAVGGGAGAMTGLPFGGYAGAYLGAKLGEHLLPSIVQPMLESPASVAAFHNATQLIKNITTGEKNMISAAKSVFGDAGKTLPHLLIHNKDTDKLNTSLLKLQKDPKQAVDSAVNDKNYLQKHAQSLSVQTTAAASWLNSQRPVSVKLNPLDTPIQPTKAQEIAFHRKLEIAQNPLIIMKNVKDGSLQASDMATLNALYPKLVPRLVQKTTEAMTNHVHDGHNVPYNTRLGLSILMGQAVDGTMQPSSIQAAQMTNKPQQQPQAGQPDKNQKQSHGKPEKLGKFSKMSMTPGQAAESDRSSRD